MSASILEEKESRINELKQMLDQQSKAMAKLQKNYNDLQSENEKLQKSLDDKSQEVDTGIEGRSLLEKEKKAKDKMYKELTYCRQKVDEQEDQLRSKDKRINELEVQVHSLEKQAVKSSQQINQIMGGIPMQPMGGMMGGYMVPNAMGGGMGFNTFAPQPTTYTPYVHTGTQNLSTENPFDSKAQNLPPPSFFAKKVVKPIRGGGKKRQNPVIGMDPYANPDPLAHQEVKHAPPINPFTPIIKPDLAKSDSKQSPGKPKTFKQMRKVTKKANYINAKKEAKKLLLDESVNGVDESINIDALSDTDSEEDTENILGSMDENNTKSNRMHPMGVTIPKPGTMTKGADLLTAMGSPRQLGSPRMMANINYDKPNPFKPKKTSDSSGGGLFKKLFSFKY